MSTPTAPPRPMRRAPGWPAPPDAGDSAQRWPQQESRPAAPPARSEAAYSAGSDIPPGPEPAARAPRPTPRQQKRADKRARRTATRVARGQAFYPTADGPRTASEPTWMAPAAPSANLPVRTWIREAIPILTLLYTALAFGGGLMSFTTVRDEARQMFGVEAWIVPLVFDVTIVTFLISDLLAEYWASLGLMDRGLPWARWVAWLFVAGTVYLNVAAAHGSTFGTVAHAGGPGAFVVVTEWIRTLIWRRARLIRRQARRRENQISRPELRWLFLFGVRAWALWRRAQEQQMLRTYSSGLQMRRLRLNARNDVPAGASRGDRRRNVQLAIAAQFGGNLPPDGSGYLATDEFAALRAELVTVVRDEVARLNSGPRQQRHTASRRPASNQGRQESQLDLSSAPPLYRELAAAFVERKDFLAVRELLTGRAGDLTVLVSWLAANITVTGAKRMMALAGLAAVGWDSTPTPVLNWLAGPVADKALLPDKREIRRMAQEIADVSGGGVDGREESAA
jgi:hypothetical protein